MITRNGLSFLRALLSSTAIKPTDLTNTNGRSDMITEKTLSGLFVTNSDMAYNSESWLTGQGVFYGQQPDFYTRSQIDMNDFSRLTNSQGVNKNEAMSTLSNTHINSTISDTNIHYLAPTEHTFTIPANPNVSTLKQLAYVSIPAYRRLALFQMTSGSSTNFSNTYVLGAADIIGIPPQVEDEYVTISYPAAFNTRNIFYDSPNLLGSNHKLTLNLGYSSDTESIDDYDLSSPVYNKKLNPMQLKVENTDSKLIFTCTFKNYEAESITINEFGVYSFFSDSNNNPIYPDDIKTLEAGRYLISNYRYIHVPITNAYISTAQAVPYLIARKVLPQAVTIPPDGVATFKYTIDLSEMQAQENITYSEE